MKNGIKSSTLLILTALALFCAVCLGELRGFAARLKFHHDLTMTIDGAIACQPVSEKADGKKQWDKNDGRDRDDNPRNKNGPGGCMHLVAGAMALGTNNPKKKLCPMRC